MQCNVMAEADGTSERINTLIHEHNSRKERLKQLRDEAENAVRNLSSRKSGSADDEAPQTSNSGMIARGTTHRSEWLSPAGSSKQPGPGSYNTQQAVGSGSQSASIDRSPADRFGGASANPLVAASYSTSPSVGPGSYSPGSSSTGGNGALDQRTGSARGTGATSSFKATGRSPDSNLDGTPLPSQQQQHTYSTERISGQNLINNMRGGGMYN